MDEIFQHLNRPFGALPDLVEPLISDLVRRLDLVWAELAVAGQQTLTVRRSGRALISDWRGLDEQQDARSQPDLRAVDDAVHAAEWCCQSNDNLSPLAAGRAGDAEPIRRASSTQPGRLSVGPCMSLC